jgi:hypothetical protein
MPGQFPQSGEVEFAVTLKQENPFAVVNADNKIGVRCRARRVGIIQPVISNVLEQESTAFSSPKERVRSVPVCQIASRFAPLAASFSGTLLHSTRLCRLLSWSPIVFASQLS